MASVNTIQNKTKLKVDIKQLLWEHSVRHVWQECKRRELVRDGGRCADNQSGVRSTVNCESNSLSENKYYCFSNADYPSFDYQQLSKAMGVKDSNNFTLQQ